MMRMGSGAGFSSDRLGPAVDLAEKAALDWLVFETIGERTLAFGHRDRGLNPERGYNPQLAARLLTCFRSWRKLEPARSALAHQGLAVVRSECYRF